jgi:hypothetical protein
MYEASTAIVCGIPAELDVAGAVAVSRKAPITFVVLAKVEKPVTSSVPVISVSPVTSKSLPIETSAVTSNNFPVAFLRVSVSAMFAVEL